MSHSVGCVNFTFSLVWFKGLALCFALGSGSVRFIFGLIWFFGSKNRALVAVACPFLLCFCRPERARRDLSVFGSVDPPLCCNSTKDSLACLFRVPHCPTVCDRKMVTKKCGMRRGKVMFCPPQRRAQCIHPVWFIRDTFIRDGLLRV